jgi:predicted Zn-dependent protease
MPVGEMIGYTSPDGSRIYMKPRENAVGIALHELGHAMGLGHTAAVGIMFYKTEGVTRIQPSDVLECRRVGACPK